MSRHAPNYVLLVASIAGAVGLPARAASLASRCAASLMAGTAVCASLDGSASAQSPPLCEARVDPTLSRRVDVTFPNRTVSLIGHQHPAGRDQADGFEYFLEDLLRGAHPATDTPALRARLTEGLDQNAEALRYWRDDLKLLKATPLGNEVETIFIEYGPMIFGRLNQSHAERFRFGRQLFPRLGFSAAQTEDLLALALTPGFYLKNLDPKFSPKMSAVEPSDAEIEAYDRAYCPAPAALAEPTEDAVQTAELTEARERFESRLRRRGVSQARIDHALNAGGDAVSRLLTTRSIADITADLYERTFFEGAGLDFTAEERADLRAMFDFKPYVEDTVADVIRRVPAELKVDHRCWGRERLLARRMADTPGPSVMFLGARHLASLGATLAAECRRRTERGGD